MPKITVRRYAEEDRDGYFKVRAVTYNDGVAIPPENQVFKTTRAFVGDVDGSVDGVFNVLDMTCNRGAAVLKCAGVAGVAVLPERRQSGVGGAMMSEAIRAFRAEGTVMASLYAFRESFYRKSGYEVCGKRMEISCPTNCYPKLKPELEVYKVPVSEVERLKPCLDAFVLARSGGNLREPLHWGRVVDDRKHLYVAGDPIEAYAIVQHSTEFWVPQFINEFVWTTKAGYEAILSTLTAIGINKTALEWWEPSDSPFVTRFLDHGVSVKSTRPIMYRVCDVPAALLHLRPAAEGSFTLRLHDKVVPENEGPWQVTFSDGEVSVEQTSSAGLEMSIQQFTQAFLGDPSLLDLARNGLIGVHDPKALETASRLLTPSPVYCLEFF